MRYENIRESNLQLSQVTEKVSTIKYQIIRLMQRDRVHQYNESRFNYDL